MAWLAKLGRKKHGLLIVQRYGANKHVVDSNVKGRVGPDLTFKSI